ncbi:MAG TPA: asparaginase domain-containing protein [Gammaproteobacteria bacterium]|nr:asparaginase domain-containing protein [Gammaproteobacteria bacterium]
MRIVFLTTGGTIDKVYFDAMSRFEVGDTVVGKILREGGVTFEFEVIPLMRKDSLEMDGADREAIRAAVAARAESRVVVTHGTDTMVDTARALAGIAGKTIVLTGALSPARFQASDAVFNIGMAVAAAQTCPPGVWIAMSGQVFPSEGVRKNRGLNRFERIEPTT